MTERARLVRISFVDTDELHPALARLLDEPLRVVVVNLEAVARLRRISVAIPFPRTDAVNIDFAFHLLDQTGFINRVGRLVPIMIRREVAMVQSALGTGHLVKLLAGFGHEPTGQDFA